MHIKKLVYCQCGSGKPYDFCCAPKINMLEPIPISDPKEREEIFKKLYIGQKFNLRYRGIFAFYGDDLIKYKLRKPKCNRRNTFLTIFGEYLTWYLEDFCPNSWEEMDFDFWEELLLAYFPTRILLTKEENQVEQFLFELENFVKWIDKRHKTKFLSNVRNLTNQYKDELYYCEHIINVLFLQKFPDFHNPDWDYKNDLEHIFANKDDIEKDEYGIFEVIEINGPICVLEDIDNKEIYHVLDLPNKELKQGAIISGGIAKLKNDWLWSWIYPEGAFPNQARKYLENIIVF